MADLDAIRGHYGSADIAERLLAALRDAGVDTERPSPDDLAPLDHFHGRGLVATRELAALLAPRADEHVLDIGCGIGGPARWIAAAYGCRIAGIDLTPEFCQAAERLTAATGQADRVEVRCASATALPFQEAAFDAAYSQNVVMNIPDKAAFYAEAFRVLRPGGRLALANLASGKGEPVYPVPWAETAATSFLTGPEETRQAIEAAGFRIEAWRDATDAYLAFQQAARERIRREGPPRLGLPVLMGERFVEMQRNTARNIEEGRVVPLEILCVKPAQ